MDTNIAPILMKALDALHLRATVTANNISNFGTVGYRPMRVTFEAALAAAAARDAEAVHAVRPAIMSAPLDPELGEPRVDRELAEMSATSARYTALVELLGRRLQLQAAALAGSGR